MSLEQKESPPPGKRSFEDLRFYQEALELLKQSYILANLVDSTAILPSFVANSKEPNSLEPAYL